MIEHVVKSLLLFLLSSSAEKHTRARTLARILRVDTHARTHVRECALNIFSGEESVEVSPDYFKDTLRAVETTRRFEEKKMMKKANVLKKTNLRNETIKLFTDDYLWQIGGNDALLTFFPVPTGRSEKKSLPFFPLELLCSLH